MPPYTVTLAWECARSQHLGTVEEMGDLREAVQWDCPGQSSLPVGLGSTVGVGKWLATLALGSGCQFVE